MKIDQLKVKLQPVVIFLQWEKRLSTFIQTANLTAMAACVLVLTFVFSGYIWGKYFSSECCLVVIFIFFAAAFIYKYWHVTDAPCWLAAARRIDRINNSHNEVCHTCELILSERDTPFAELAVARGVDILERFSIDKLVYERPGFNWHVIVGAMVSVFLYYVLLWPVLISEQLSYPEPEKALSTIGAVDLDKRKIDNKYYASNLVGTMTTARQINLVDGISAVQTSFSGRGSSAEFGVKNDPGYASMKEYTKTGGSTVPDDNGTVRYNKTGRGQSPQLETFIDCDHLQSSASADTDQESADSADKRIEPKMSKAANLPFVDDGAAAPGRELGRSGKKGKPGEGRGGAGSVKKSRATAAYLSGGMISVFLKSRKSKGFSKSFLTKNQSREICALDAFSFEEGAEKPLRLPVVEDNMKEITRRYFEGLNINDNRLYKTGN